MRRVAGAARVPGRSQRIGKEQFLDALRFIADSLRFSIDHALRDRGGINDVRRRSGGHPTHFGIRVEFTLSGGAGHYAFAVGARPKGGYEVQHEECLVVEERPHYYRVERSAKSRFTRPGQLPPSASEVPASGGG